MHSHDAGDDCATPGRRRYRMADDLVDGTAHVERLAERDEVDAERLDDFLAARQVTRRDVLRLGSVLGFGTVASPLLEGADVTRAWPLYRPMAGGAAVFPADQSGRVHTVPSIMDETVHVGRYDPSLAPILTIDSGDTVVYPDTLTHYGGRIYPGISLEEREALRREFAPWSAHSNVGPIALRGAEPGDVIECRIVRMDPLDWGYNNSSPGTGTLPTDFADPRIRFFQFDKQSMTTEFMPGLTIPLGPFQGILGVQPAGDQPVSSSPPGPYAGNMDLRELIEGTVLYVPVWHRGGKIWTSDSHAAQGDGEVNLTAIETAMREARIQFVLHKHVNLRWPLVETPTHWISLGMDVDLNQAHMIALRQMIELLEVGMGFEPLDAYSLCSVAATFRVTQSVNASRGVHGMLAKDLFRPELQQRMRMLASRPARTD